MCPKYKILFLGLFLYTGNIAAQSFTKSLNDTAMVADMATSKTAAPVSLKKWNQIRTRHFTLNLGLAFLYDFNFINQDATNIAQVGKVTNAGEFRGERIVATGTFFSASKNPWRYMISVNYNGLDAPPDKKNFDLIDWNIDIPLSKTAGWITVGKQKEGVGLEYILPGTQGMFTERGSGAPAFVRQRNIGIRYSNSILKERLTYTMGFFNNAWETGKSFSENGNQFTSRVSGLPHYASDGDLLHLGVAWRYTDANSGALSYKAKPEANTAPSFINTNSFVANSAGTIMLEAMLVKKSLSFIAEYMRVKVNSHTTGNPNFHYYQMGGSWFITGEHRRYNKATGNPGKLIPNSTFQFRKHKGIGALEFGMRYTHTNLADKLVQGGMFNRFTTAFSWYPNAHFRYEINYGIGSLDRNNLEGKTNFWQIRAQFEL